MDDIIGMSYEAAPLAHVSATLLLTRPRRHRQLWPPSFFSFARVSW